MPRPAIVPRLYAIADTGALGEERTAEAAGVMARAGVAWIQLRAKGMPGGRLTELTSACLAALEGTESRLWIDDRVDVASLFDHPALGGVHVGQEDLPPEAVRSVVGHSLWIGSSTHGDDQVREAHRDEAVDVVALGPIFPTRSKERPDPVVGLEGLRRARALTSKPLVAIGGLDFDSIPAVLAAGADSVVLLGAVCRGDVRSNCERLLARAKENA